MKKSELRQLIREELKKSLKEGFRDGMFVTKGFTELNIEPEDIAAFIAGKSVFAVGDDGEEYEIDRNMKDVNWTGKEELKEYFPKDLHRLNQIKSKIYSDYKADDVKSLIDLIEDYGQERYEEGLNDASQPENY